MSRPSRMASCHPDRPHVGRGLCNACYCREQHKKNPGIRRDGNFRRLYGITLEEYNRMVEQQNGVCASCGFPPEGRKPLVVDHHHESGKVRGLLCQGCNIALGQLKESPEKIESLLKYARQHVIHP